MKDKTRKKRRRLLEGPPDFKRDGTQMGENVKKKQKSKMGWLWENMKGYRVLYIVGLLGTMVYSVMQLIVPYATQNLIDLFLTGDDAAANLVNRRTLFYQLIIAMVALTFLRTLIVYLTCMSVEHVSQKALYRIRNYLFEKIERQDMKFYSTFRTGDLMTRLTGDLDAVRHMIAWVLRTITESLALVCATAVYFLYMDWRLALCLLAISPFIFLIIILFKNKVAPRHKALREKLAQMNTAAQENISGNRVVKAFAREDYEMERFDRCNTEYARTNKRTAMTWLAYYPYVESFANLMPVVLLAVGGVFIIGGQLTMGEYVAFSGLIWAIANPMRQLGNIMNEFQRFSAAADKVMEIYYSEPEIVDKPDAIDRPERFEGRVEFKNVSFQYADGNLPVLHNVSFTVSPGETVAIMGETGCGKTSLIQLIPRFYEPTEGEVLVDGVNVQDMKLTQLRKNIGLATQDVLLYSDTIDGNIAYGDTHIKPEEVVKFARYSAASDFIAKMPEGYDTIVGERGVGLSGGQKQRISLARALAVRPSILILDDTTSAVDMETEKQIQHSLKELDFPCTKIIIAQRISTTKSADKILVLQDGRITESGTHEELVAKKGYYYSLVKLQTGEEDGKNF
ncbi:MAG: ABC transporter ATP-binding protein/permease [Butyrivibrio sp.]|nr:ABC transporter ATP-binding protein/permease [Acetatifactor muris]MCM1558605.1 ABC transporter ATP-binding protein/permease [Butyrivibrio sp.]